MLFAAAASSSSVSQTGGVLVSMVLGRCCRSTLDVAARLVFGVQYEPQLRHLIEHLLTRLGMLTYYWPCSQLRQPVTPLPRCSSCHSLALALAFSLSPYLSADRWFVYGTYPSHIGAVCVSATTASVSEVCSYLTVKAFIIIRLNLKTFWSGLSC